MEVHVRAVPLSRGPEVSFVQGRSVFREVICLLFKPRGQGNPALVGYRFYSRQAGGGRSEGVPFFRSSV